jgi:DDE superfamily endonuclease
MSTNNDNDNNFIENFDSNEGKVGVLNQYTLNQKKAYAQMVREKGAMATHRETGVPISNLKRWKKTFPELNGFAESRQIRSDKRIRLKGGGRKSTISDDIQEELVEWVNEMRDKDIEVNGQWMVQKLISIDGVAFAPAPRRALRRRIWRVLDRNDYSIRKTTHQAQTTRLSEREKLDFVSYIEDKMKALEIDKSAVCNFDETNVGFSWDSKTTINKKGAKTITVAGAESSQRCTAMIGVSGSGYKFPPFVIFKGSNKARAPINRLFKTIDEIQKTTTEGQQEGYPLSIKYAVQANAWMDSTTMHKWIDDVYIPWATEIDGPNLVILDVFTVHAMSEIVNRIADYQGHVELLPAHSTSVLQVMDVGINKPFKNHLKNEYDKWRIERIDDRNAKPFRWDVSQWIEKAWTNITATTINKTWKHIGWNFDETEIIDHDFGYVDNDSDFMHVEEEDSSDEEEVDETVFY